MYIYICIITYGSEVWNRGMERILQTGMELVPDLVPDLIIWLATIQALVALGVGRTQGRNGGNFLWSSHAPFERPTMDYGPKYVFLSLWNYCFLGAFNDRGEEIQTYSNCCSRPVFFCCVFCCVRYTTFRAWGWLRLFSPTCCCTCLILSWIKTYYIYVYTYIYITIVTTYTYIYIYMCVCLYMYVFVYFYPE